MNLPFWMPAPPAVCTSIFTFAEMPPTLPSMTNFWFSANYYYVFLGYNRRGPQSRVQ